MLGHPQARCARLLHQEITFLPVGTFAPYNLVSHYFEYRFSLDNPKKYFWSCQNLWRDAKSDNLELAFDPFAADCELW